MEDFRIKIAKDFSDTPGPREISEGPFSGELFRTEILSKKFAEVLKEKDAVLIVDLDGTHGYGSSFLEESFGGLVREFGEGGVEIVLPRIKVISNEEPYLVDDIDGYIKDALKNGQNQ